MCRYYSRSLDLADIEFRSRIPLFSDPDSTSPVRSAIDTKTSPQLPHGLMAGQSDDSTVDISTSASEGKAVWSLGYIRLGGRLGNGTASGVEAHLPRVHFSCCEDDIHRLVTHRPGTLTKPMGKSWMRGAGQVVMRFLRSTLLGG